MDIGHTDQRYYGVGSGRFNTPDPYMANNGGPGDPADPASWNRYAYVAGDPINYIDPSGQVYGPRPPDPPDPTPPIPGPPMPVPHPVPAPLDPPASFKMVVTGFSRTVPKETTIAGVLQKILDDILSQDNDCSRWLSSNTNSFTGKAFVQAILGGGPSDYTFGYGQLNSAGTAAFVGNANADGTVVRGLPLDASITVNSNGAFFNSAYSVSSQGYTGGTLQAQAFILLHELAHEVGAPGFKSNDAGPTREAVVNQASNNALVDKNCGKAVKGLQ